MGAGLQESRLNTELIAFLKKYGNRALLVLLVVVLAYVGLSRYQEWQVARAERAFLDYEAARATGDPTGLVRVAEEHGGIRSVASLARLEAATRLIASARTGLRPGSNPAQPADEDLLSEEERSGYLTEADRLLSSVIADLQNRPEKTLLAQTARWERVSVLVGLGRDGDAGSVLEEFSLVAEREGYPTMAMAADSRRAVLARLADAAPVYPEAELPDSARDAQPERPAVPASDLSLPRMPDGVTIRQLQGTEMTPDLRKMIDEQFGEDVVPDSEAGEPEDPPTPATPGG